MLKMSIGTDEKLHGVSIFRLILEFERELSDCTFSIKKGRSRNAYLLKGIRSKVIGRGRSCEVGLFIKVSNMRRSPWRFNFLEDHQNEIAEMKGTLEEAFVVFVAGDDGICCVDFEEHKKLLDEVHERQEWVSLSRRHGQNYRLRGKDSDEDLVVSRSSFPSKIIECLRSGLKK